MLHKETVTSQTLDLIYKLQQDPYFDAFYLVGGTGLSLQIGQCTSIDIDLFTQDPFDSQQFLEYLEEKYDFQMQFSTINKLKGIIDGAFVDLITHKYPHVLPVQVIDGIRLSSKPDIAAMKVNAITGNGTRSKDFIDIYFLLKEYSFSDLLTFYKTKYGQRNDFHAAKSLIYFEDIDASDWPKLLVEKDIDINHITSIIRERHDKFIRSL